MDNIFPLYLEPRKSSRYFRRKRLLLTLTLSNSKFFLLSNSIFLWYNNISQMFDQSVQLDRCFPGWSRIQDRSIARYKMLSKGNNN